VKLYQIQNIKLSRNYREVYREATSSALDEVASYAYRESIRLAPLAQDILF